MGVLAPLYIAGLLAIGLPILFHLIRRSPHGRQDFSSLMFLAPSPPRLTRRSRLTNILLLLLRAAALALLAFAFARPFFRQDADATVSQARGRRVAVLVDTSASMQRGDLWQQATRQAEEALAGVGPADEVALFFFDRTVRPGLGFNEWNDLDGSRRAAAFRARLAGASPTWDASHLGEALATVADLLTAAEDPKSAGADRSDRQLVLVSDMQQGSRIESLQGFEWPQNVGLEVRPVALKQTTNAAVQLEKADPARVAAGDENRLRVRVSNQPDSAREQFTLAWADERGPPPGAQPVKAYVPPGRSQLVRVPWPTGDRPADRLVLAGDDFDFDNTLYVVPPRTDTVRLVYVGDDTAEDVKGLRYYLHRALGDAPGRKVEVVARRADESLAEPDLLGARLAVVAAALPPERVNAVRRFAETGGDVLWVVKDAAAESAALRALTGVEGLTVEEAKTRDFALIGRVDYEHPLFAPFADARFSDFTKIHFWKHRKLALPEGTPARVLAWFDGGDPFLVEQTVGQGRVLIATSGWHPADSQLALSTKFVPLLEGLLRRKDGGSVESQHAVHEPIALPKTTTGEARTIAGPDGRRVEIAGDAATFDGADRPGVYRLSAGGQETPLAVNLSPEESRTAPLAVEELEQRGVRLWARPVSNDELVIRQRQLQVMELENRQKVWRWLIVAVLGILAVETALAGRLTRRATDVSAAEPQGTT